MNYEKCEKCKEYDFFREGESCNCKEFKIIHEDGDEYTFYGIDEEDVATKYAEYSNEANDYHLINDTVNISVNGIKFSIGAKPDFYYFANEIT